MVRGIFRTCIAALAMASLDAAYAQAPSPPPPSDDIVVTGSRTPRREVEKAARAVTPPGDLYHEPLARFQQPVCPGVVGMPARFAASLTTRIRAVAERARVRLAPASGCKANLLVIFVPNGQAALQAMRHKRAWLFGNIEPAQLKDLAADPGLSDLAADPAPAHAWVNIETRNRYGEALKGQDDPGAPAMLTAGGTLSRIALMARQDIVASVVVIDIAAMQDMSVEQIADYAAMRGLARTRPPGRTGTVGTILSLFDRDAVPPLELTRFDLAYLRAIYGSPATIAAISKVAQVAQEMKKAARQE